LDALKVKVKGGSQMLSMMRRLVKQVERAAKDIANRPDLVISGRRWKRKDCMKLYKGVENFFQVPGNKTKRRYKTLSWQAYYSNGLLQQSDSSNQQSSC
jgi:hypothetical protein